MGWSKVGYLCKSSSIDTNADAKTLVLRKKTRTIKTSKRCSDVFILLKSPALHFIVVVSQNFGVTSVPNLFFPPAVFSLCRPVGRLIPGRTA